MQIQIGKWGNSLAVRLPGNYAKDLGLKEGMNLDISVADGSLLLRPRRQEYSLEELVAESRTDRESAASE
jgi:antitoxin MazE